MIEKQVMIRSVWCVPCSFFVVTDTAPLPAFPSPPQLVLSKQTFSKAVQDCAATIKSTNSNIARLNRTQQHSSYADYLKVPTVDTSQRNIAGDML